MDKSPSLLRPAQDRTTDRSPVRQSFAAGVKKPPKVEVNVVSFEGAEEKSLIGSSYYTNFVIEVTYKNSTWAVLRRYKQFYVLNEKLKKKFTEDPFPRLPSRLDDNSDLAVISSRKQAFDFYLKELAKNYDIISSPEMQVFLDFHQCPSNIFEDLSGGANLAVPLLNREIGKNYRDKYRGYSDLLNVLHELHLIHNATLVPKIKQDKGQANSDGSFNEPFKTNQNKPSQLGKGETRREKEIRLFEQLGNHFKNSPSACLFYLPQIAELFVYTWETKSVLRLIGEVCPKSAEFTVFLAITLSHIMNREKFNRDGSRKYSDTTVLEHLPMIGAAEGYVNSKSNEENHTTTTTTTTTTTPTSSAGNAKISRKYFQARKLLLWILAVLETEAQPNENEVQKFERMEKEVDIADSKLASMCEAQTIWKTSLYNKKSEENFRNSQNLSKDQIAIRKILKDTLIFLTSLAYASQQLLSLPKDEALRFEALRETFQWLDDNFLPSHICFPTFLNIKFALNIPTSINDIDLLRSKRNAPFLIRFEYLRRPTVSFKCFEPMIEDLLDRPPQKSNPEDYRHQQPAGRRNSSEDLIQDLSINDGEAEDEELLKKLKETRRSFVRTERNKENGEDQEEGEDDEGHGQDDQDRFREDDEEEPFFTKTQTLDFQQVKQSVHGHNNKHPIFDQNNYHHQTITMNTSAMTSSLEPTFRDSTTLLTSPALPQFSETWVAALSRLATESPYSNSPDWRVLPLIVKSNNDVWQEQFVMQLLDEIQRLWRQAHLPLRLTVYRILAGLDLSSSSSSSNVPTTSSTPMDSVSASAILASNSNSMNNNGPPGAQKKVGVRESGIVEAVPNAFSLHSIKKNTKGKSTLLNFFAEKCGGLDSKEFFEIQQNFVESTAAYSLISYFLHVKDRHNGNILIDIQGNVIHVGYAKFLNANLTSLPGVVVEVVDSAPFKLTDEMIEMMDGLNSNLWNYYCRLCVLGFLQIQKNIFQLANFIDIMLAAENFECFARPKTVITDLMNRARIQFDTHHTAQYVLGLIAEAIDSPSSSFFDLLQYASNGIL